MMLNPEGSHPEYFEELCALAASGQISEPEFVELQDHLQDCARCQSAYDDFIELLHNKLPLVGSERIGSSWRAGLFSTTSSYRERFLARARKQGLAVSYPSLIATIESRLGIGLWPISYAQVAMLAMALLLLTAGILGYGLRRSDALYTTLAANMAAMSQRFSQQGRPERSPARESQSVIPPRLETPPPPPAGVAARVVAEAEFQRVREDYTAAEARSKVLQDQLRAAASELESFKAQQEQASDSRNQVEKKLAAAELALARASDELEGIRQGRAVDAATVAAQAREIRELSVKLAAQTEILDRETMLLAASRDIHDLMGARNLHILDVLDVDSKGKDRRAFGRVSTLRKSR
jgi:hypothetical protein